jgi:hypothetical protein
MSSRSFAAAILARGHRVAFETSGTEAGTKFGSTASEKSAERFLSRHPGAIPYAVDDEGLPIEAPPASPAAQGSTRAPPPTKAPKTPLDAAPVDSVTLVPSSPAIVTLPRLIEPTITLEKAALSRRRTKVTDADVAEIRRIAAKDPSASRAGMARYLGCSPSTISKIISGMRRGNVSQE